MRLTRKIAAAMTSTATIRSVHFKMRLNIRAHLIGPSRPGQSEVPAYRLSIRSFHWRLGPFRVEFPTMTKRVLFAVAGFLGLCLPLSAQRLSGPEQLLLGGSALDYAQSPWVSLENRDRFLFSTAFGSMRPSENYLPAFDPSGPLTYSAPRSMNDKNPVDNIVELTAPSRFYYGGEMGFLYGKSTGKYGRE